MCMCVRMFIFIVYHIIYVFLFSIRAISILDKDKNFALETYGDDSRCFDHTNQMWEERSCRQVRQWQHWGSGCYQFHCYGGRLHISVCISMQ